MKEKISPTRMNLIVTRKRIAGARRGYDILKRKREVIAIEFLRILRESKMGRMQLKGALDRGYGAAAKASTFVGDFELDRAAEGIEESSRIRMATKNVMGVRIPEITVSQKEGRVFGAYSVLSTSTAVDDVRDAFEEAASLVINVARREQGLKRLVVELDKTKRRVNALQYVLIPELSRSSKYISMRLDEMDRDMFSALKHVKKRLKKGEE